MPIPNGFLDEINKRGLQREQKSLFPVIGQPAILFRLGKKEKKTIDEEEIRTPAYIVDQKTQSASMDRS